MDTIENQPILIHVGEKDWTAHSLSPVASERDNKLFLALQMQGGISDTVRPGYYHFNVDFETKPFPIATLEKAIPPWES